MGKEQSKQGRQREALGDHKGAINNMVISEDGSLLVTTSDDKTARLWSVRTPETECIGVLKGHKSFLTAVAVCDTYVVTGSADGSIRKWDMSNCDCVFIYEGHKSRIQRILVTGEFVFSTSHDRTARMWLFDTDKIPPDHTDRACIRVFEGHRLAVFPLIFIAGRLPVTELDDNCDLIQPGDLLITGSADTTARSWAVDTGTTLRIFSGHTMGIVCMATDGDGRTLFTGSTDGNIRMWLIQNGECLKVMDGHREPVLCLLMVNRLLYSTSSDGTARCWVPEFGDCIRVYRGHQSAVICLKIHDGILYTGSSDTWARAFDAKIGTLLAVYKGHTETINCITVAHGKVFTGSYDSTLRVWDVAHVEGMDMDLDDEEEEAEEDKAQRKTQQQNLDELDERLDKFIIDDNDEGHSLD